MTYAEHHAALVAYLRSCLDRSDWHGVSDAANDLRVLEAKPPLTQTFTVPKGVGWVYFSSEYPSGAGGGGGGAK